MHVEPFESVDPVAPALRLARRRGSCWLDGDAGHGDGRWSFLGCEPVERVERRAGDALPLRALDALARSSREPDQHTGVLGAPQPNEVPRWVGYLAYDAAWCGRKARLPRAADRTVLSFARYDALLAIDGVSQRAYLVGDDAAACARLRSQLNAACTREPVALAGAILGADRAQHRAAIACALEHIARGDVYQVNLARCFRAPFSGEPLALWLAQRAASPVPFGFYFDDGARVLCVRTMERFLRWHCASGELITRPIKGTLARTGGRDALEAQALASDGKERAEHAMIVDLMRNDLGRVAVVGSVGVPQVMAVEPFAGLHHLVSTVRCVTRGDVDLRAIVEATFPPGSVTGAPKLAAIEIIEALEPVARDVYTGAVGFVDRSGGLSLAVAIRSTTIEAGEARYFAGGGIVEASDPEREVAETELKAQVFVHSMAALAQRNPTRDRLVG